MRLWALAGAAGAALAAWSGTAGASGDYGCAISWSLAVSSRECAGTAVIGPRNDTRVNLAFLLRDRPGAASGPVYPKWDWIDSDYGRVFVDWGVLQRAFWPQPPASEPPSDQPAYAGSRCQTLVSGGAAFRAALAAGKGLSAEDRAVLGAARDLVQPACEGDKGAAAWPALPGKAAQAWLGYLQGARAFYADDFATARARFADLARAGDPWLAETGRYMIARNELAAAQAGAFDEWGDFTGPDAVDRASAERARAALRDYLTAYRQGRYAASATGLTRRAAWLLGEAPVLTKTYAGLLAGPAQSPALVDEVEAKVFFGLGRGSMADAPLLLATWDLLRMRRHDPVTDLGSEAPATLTAQELERQAPVFAREPELYGFLQASFAFHVAQDYRRVLTLIPDDARAKRHTALGFSRQMLRGLALEKLGDRNAAGFFQQMAGGARDLYQQPAVQLALAMNWERSGGLAKVFADGSPITEPEIRTILLTRVARPELLRRQASTAAPVERDVAAFTLLTKALSRGHYAAFGRDLALVPVNGSTTGTVGEGWVSGWMDPNREQAPPLGLFTRGQWSESYPCPALAKTAATLAANPRDVKARLCLGEFWRLNGFDDYLAASGYPPADQLGGTTDLFPGKVAPRAALYAAVLADTAAGPEDTAYALYRSVQCYAPSGNNACGGADVPEARRKAWFQRLKREFPSSRWAIDLKYYW
jgi:hypothetical protein